MAANECARYYKCDVVMSAALQLNVAAGLQGLNLFKGGVLMVSHDQFLIESTVDELWAVEGGRITPFHGTFEEYKRRLRDQAKK